MKSQATGHRSGLTSTHPLAYVRQARGWSYQELARVVADNARALGVPMAARREKVWRWEHWGVVPEPDSQRALARALGVPLGEVDARPWPRWLPAHGGVPSGLPWTAAGAMTALQSLLDGGGEDARGYPIIVGQALRDATSEWAAAAATGCEPPDGTTRSGIVDERTADWLEAGVLGLRRLDDRLGGAAVRHRVEADLRTVSDLLGRGTHSRSVGIRLFRVAADLAHLGGWAGTDTGRHGAAQRHFLTGLRLAHAALDRPLAAAVLGGLSLQAVLTGRPQDALDTADAAARAAQGMGSPRVRAMLATRQARANAAIGNEIACRRAVADAEERFAVADGYRDPPWIYWFDAAALAGETGLALLDLGLAGEARAALDQALDSLGPGQVRDRAVYAVGAAEAHILAGAPDRGAELADTAAALAVQCGTPRLAAALDEVRALLEERGTSRSLREFDRRGGTLPA